MRAERLFDGKWRDLWYARDGNGGFRSINVLKMSDSCGTFMAGWDTSPLLSDRLGDLRFIDCVIGEGFHDLKKGRQRKIRVRMTREIQS